MTKDYYVILGVGPGETAAGIRDAYRDLAKTHHPDRAGPNAAPRFRDIVEAYEVLSDPRRREAYDRTRPGRAGGAAEGGRRSSGVGSWPGSPGPVRPEPIVPDRDPDPDRDRRRRPRQWDVEVVLSPREAAAGPYAPIDVPGWARCARCRGFGRVGLDLCLQCRGEGVAGTTSVVHVPIPPMVEDGTILEAFIGGLGRDAIMLRLHIRVVEYPRLRWR